MAVQPIRPYWLVVLVLVLVMVAWVGIEWAHARQALRSGALPRKLTRGQQAVLSVPVVPLWIAAEIVDDRGDWVWLVAAGVAAAWTIGFGAVHNRRARA